MISITDYSGDIMLVSPAVVNGVEGVRFTINDSCVFLPFEAVSILTEKLNRRVLCGASYSCTVRGDL